MVGPVLQAVVPYRLRGMGTALSTMYIFFIGGFLGGLVAGFLTDAIGVRGTVIVLGVPTAIIGGLLLMNGARFIRNDLSLVVEELLEEQEEHHKRTTSGVATPVLQLANIDFSYGPVQVLFDVDFEVQQGRDASRCSAPTAPASRRPARRSAASACPSAASCGSTARTSPTSSPETRARQLGIMQLPGGKGVFPSLTVEQNLARQRPAQRDGPTARSTQRIARRLRAVPRARRPPQADRRAACRAASSRCSRSARVLHPRARVL